MKQNESFHMTVNKIPLNTKTGFNNLHGFGGMSIGYVDIPSPADLTPFFEGLPGNLCPSPHWGYVLEGSIRVIFGNGKEETISEGEVFYLPALHTGIVDKSVKFIEFSPDKEFIQLMEHVAKLKEKSAEKISES